jgi:type II secretion system protein H
VKDRGFSFIEIMVVLVLLGLAVALVAPSLSQFSRSVELKAAAKKVSAILRYCRSEAVNQGKVYQVFFDPDLRVVRFRSMESTEGKGEDEQKGADQQKEGKAREKAYFLPDRVHMKEVKVESPQYPSDLATIEFYPNGGSNGGTILLDSENLTGYKIKIHFLTGMVAIEKV